MTISAGSTVVDMNIATVDGTDAAASALMSEINAAFETPSLTSTKLGVPVLSLTSSLVTAAPATPPAAPIHNPPPPLTPPIPLTPSAPPASPAPSPPKESGVDLIVIIIASVSGALILAVIAFVCFFMPKTNTNKTNAYSARKSQPPAVVVYAESAWNHSVSAEYMKI
jgi:hypothetical protein